MTGNAERINQVLDQIALEVMGANADDLSVLGRIDTGLETLAEETRGSRPHFTRLAGALSQLIAKLILEECGELSNPLEVLAQGISALQHLQRSCERQGREEGGDLGEAPALLALLGAGEEAPEPQAEEPELDPEALVAGMGEEEAPAEPPLVDADIFFDFLSEAEDHLNTAENTLLSLEGNPDNGELLNEVFRSFHTIKGAAGFLNLADVTHVAHAVEDVLDSVRKGKLQINAAILDVALEAIDLLKALLAGVQAQLAGGAAPPQDLAGFLSRVGEAAAGHASVPQGRTGAAGAPAAPAENAAPSEPRHQDQNFVRVSTAKLDQLVNMVGELVIAQTQVSQNAEVKQLHGEKLTRDIGQLDRTTRDIQEVAMSMRMVPIRPTFERMARMVRDLARKLGKEVEFRMAGEETELDKSMVEEIVDPLIHMVRNAVDHGVESPEERRAAGKPEKGAVALEAYHKGGSIVIELRDDGKGLDREKILKKAVERGLAQPGEEFSDEQVFDFIFRPGFSLAKQISDVSGRGVGMDVVRRNIEKLRGKVELRSTLGKGSTFAIHLPLTLAIIEGMVVGVGEERYVLPLTSIVRSLRPSREQIFTVLGEGEMVKMAGELLPLLRLHQRFAIDPVSEAPWEGLVVLVEAEGARCCLLVDQLLGIQQVVIKGLEDDLRKDRSLAGCTILGDGQVGLILEVNSLVQQARGRKEEMAAEQAA